LYQTEPIPAAGSRRPGTGVAWGVPAGELCQTEPIPGDLPGQRILPNRPNSPPNCCAVMMLGELSLGRRAGLAGRRMILPNRPNLGVSGVRRPRRRGVRQRARERAEGVPCRTDPIRWAIRSQEHAGVRQPSVPRGSAGVHTCFPSKIRGSVATGRSPYGTKPTGSAIRTQTRAGRQGGSPAGSTNEANWIVTVTLC
jgi:hypothetical protein